MRPTGGIRRYATELERAIGTFGHSERIGEGLGLRVSALAGSRVGGTVARMAVDAQTEFLSRRADIAHSVYYDCSVLGKRMPLVATFHDCIHERFSMTGRFRSSALARFKRLSVSRARFVVSVSQSTARDVAEFYGLEPDRSVVISPPVGDVFTTYAGGSSEGESVPFYMFVGRRDSYKNWGLQIGRAHV